MKLTQWGGSPTALRQPNPITAIGVSRNGRFVVTGDQLGFVRVFELSSKRLTATVKVREKTTEVITWNGDVIASWPLRRTAGIAFSADGRWIVTRGERGELAFVNAKTGETERTLRTPNHKPAFGIAFSADGKRLGVALRRGDRVRDRRS